MEKITIIVDDREKSLFEAFNGYLKDRSGTDNLTVIKERITIGDIAIYFGSTLVCVIERKKLKDFCASITDGRMDRQTRQMKLVYTNQENLLADKPIDGKICQLYTKLYVVIEDKRCGRLHTDTNLTSKIHNLSKYAVKQKILSLQIKHGLHFAYTCDTTGTMTRIMDIISTYLKLTQAKKTITTKTFFTDISDRKIETTEGNKLSDQPLERKGGHVPTVFKTIELSTRDQALKVMEVLPKIGTGKAINILRKYSMYCLMFSDRLDFADVPLVSNQMGAKIKEFITSTTNKHKALLRVKNVGKKNYTRYTHLVDTRQDPEDPNLNITSKKILEILTYKDTK